MPAPFVPVHVPFVSGPRQDIGSLTAENPAQLRDLENVVFTLKGHINGRPGLVSRNAQVQTTGAGGALIANLGTAASGLTPAGIVSAAFSTDAGPDTPLLAYQGGGFFFRSGVWIRGGSMWSMRATKSAALLLQDTSTSTRLNPVPVGQHVVNQPVGVGATTGIPLLNDKGEVTSVSLGTLANYSSTNNLAAAGDAIFFGDNATNTLYGHIPTTLPAVTQVTVGANADVGAAAQKMSAVMDPQGTAYYVAYKSTVAGQITLVRLNSAGTVTQTLNVGGLGGVDGVSIALNGAANRLGLVYHSATTVKTKIFTITAGVMADAAIDLTLTGTALIILGLDVGTFHAGRSHNDQLSVLFTKNNGDCYIGGRSFTAATETAIMTLSGVYAGGGDGLEWDPLFAGVVVGGRTLIGVWRCTEYFNQTAQWVVLDVTSLYASGVTTDRDVVAAGPANGSARLFPSSVYSTATSVQFLVPDGVAFAPAPSGASVPIVRRVGYTRVTLATQPVQAVQAHGVTLLSGQYPFVFDGSAVRPHSFPEDFPYINSNSADPAGGTLTAGSYSYQVTWEAMNARGQVIRSSASNIHTRATVALNDKVQIHTTFPQLWNYVGSTITVRVRLWATKVNPTPGADKFFVTETTVASATGVTVMLEHLNPVTGNEEVLYESGDVFGDMHAPGGDRGVAFANERAWTADQNHVYASKLLLPSIGLSFNTEGLHTFQVPTALGSIQGLAGLGDRVVVVCSSGVAIISGSGVDDGGNGVGWTVDVLDGAPGAGMNASPRAVTATPQGVAYAALDGDIWLVGPSFQVMPISRPVRDYGSDALDVVYVTGRPSEGSTHPLLFARTSTTWRVLDLEAAQWCAWTFFADVRHIASVNGEPWVQLGTDPRVASLTGDPGDDLGNVVQARITTGVIRPDDPARKGWGRVRGFTLSGTPASAAGSLQINAEMYGDDNGREMMNKQKTVNFTTPGNWPGEMPEFRTTSQRCSTAQIILTLTPAFFDLEGFDLWVSSQHESSPNRNRS